MKILLWSGAGLLFMMVAMEPLSGQHLLQDPVALRQQSIQSFEAGEYRTALKGLSRLRDAQPDEPMWSYYSGRCLVELNEDLDEAIEMLFAASTRGVPNDVNYYLGLAYHRNYNFTDALRYFGRFEQGATRQELKVFDPGPVMATSRSAMEITSTFNPFEVLNVSFIDLYDSLQFRQIKMKGGVLQRKSQQFFRDGEERTGITSLMFIPEGTLRGDYIYFAGYTRSGKEGAQLFRVRKGAGRSWGEPEEIPALNSDGDDVMPYFDPVEDDLYFASNGRPGIGGYDLYRSHYDRERDAWSEPMNLGFPINSVMDDVLLLPGSDLGMFIFFTTRRSTDTTMAVFRVHLAEPKEKTVPNDFEMLQRIASLGGVADDLLAELEEMETGPSAGPGPAGNRPATADPDQPVITPVTILPEKRTDTQYRPVLAEALRHQAASDSLKDLATTARIRVRESEDPNDRWVWQQQIMLWEKRATEEEDLADELYLQVALERDASSVPRSDLPGTIEVDTVMDDLTVYRYTGTADQPGNDSPGGGRSALPENAAPPATGPPVSSGPARSVSGPLNNFDLLEDSPYGPGNPIPTDLPLPGGTIYRIQLGAFSREVAPDAFGGICPIHAERIKERGLIKYYAGQFSRYEDASSALSIIRSEGFEDAFMVAWYNGNAVATERAKQLE